MKIPLLLPLFFVACASIKPITDNTKTNTTYKVYKIDSINSYYLIYAKKNDSLFKIVSKKATPNNDEKIKINKRYSFKLHSSLISFYIGKAFVNMKDLHIGGFAYDDSTVITREKDLHYELYYADNIIGLYFVK